MTWISRLTVGMPVYALDGRLGSIVTVPRVAPDDLTAPAEAIVLASQEAIGPGVEEFLRVPREMVARIENDALYLNVRRADVPAASSAALATQRLADDGEHLTIPLVEEEVNVTTRVVDMGHIHLQKKVDELVDERTVDLRQQDVQVERVPIDEIVPEVIEPYMDGDAYVVPVIEEEVVIQRRLRLKELLRISRVGRARQETLRTPYRRERIVVEEQRYEEPAGPSPTKP